MNCHAIFHTSRKTRSCLCSMKQCPAAGREPKQPSVPAARATTRAAGLVRVAPGPVARPRGGSFFMFIPPTRKDSYRNRNQNRLKSSHVWEGPRASDKPACGVAVNALERVAAAGRRVRPRPARHVARPHALATGFGRIGALRHGPSVLHPTHGQMRDPCV